MSEQQQQYIPLSHERDADKAISSGRLDLAGTLLLDAILQSYTHDPRAYHHASLKSASLPLHELARRSPTIEDLAATKQTVQNSIANFIASELTSPDVHSNDPEVRYRRVGRITEDVFWYHAVRSLKPGADIYVPASYTDDRRKKTDFISLPPAGATRPPKRFQTKTKMETSPQKINGVIFVAMNHIDPNFHRHETSDSLARSIVHEQLGTAEWADIQRLDQAEAELTRILNGTSSQN